MAGIFVDTWAWRAVADRGDAGHSLAVGINRDLRRRGERLVTTDYVLDESATGLRRWVGASGAARWLSSTKALVEDAAVELVWTSEARFEAASLLFAELNGKFPELSFTDCLSFAIMRELHIDAAFTADDHFVKAGSFERLVEPTRRGFRRAPWSGWQR
jgi:predicted nucleic acid-binding protein